MDAHQSGSAAVKIFASTYGDIHLGAVREGLAETIEALKPSSLVVVADTHTHHFCFPIIEPLVDCTLIVIEPGEQHKTIESCEKIWSALLAAGADRSALVLNLGGGMICDLGGLRLLVISEGYDSGIFRLRCWP